MVKIQFCPRPMGSRTPSGSEVLYVSRVPCVGECIAPTSEGACFEVEAVIHTPASSHAVADVFAVELPNRNAR